MILLIDAHVLLWWLTDAPTFSQTIRAAILDGKNLVFASATVTWEMAIKRALGKLGIPSNLEAALTAN